MLWNCLLLGVPSALAAVAYGFYNYARFDSVSEFGLTYQATTLRFNGNAGYVLPNLLSYLFAPVNWNCGFPYLHILSFRPLSTLITWPSGYLTFEKLGGIMFTSIWCWMVLLVLAQLAEFALTRVRHSSPPSAASDLSGVEVWLLVCSVAIMLSMAPVLTQWEGLMRYVGDAMGGITIAATLGAFWILRRSHSERHPGYGFVARGLVLTLGIHTCIAGVLASFGPMEAANPVLYERLGQTLSFCRKGPGNASQ